MKKTLVAFLLVVLSVILAPSRTAYAADVDSLKNGDIVEFGMYPQKRVTDLDLIAELDDVAKNWKAYPYHSKNTAENYHKIPAVQDNSMMKFADFTYNNKKYRAVKILKYRPGTADMLPGTADDPRGSQYENGFRLGVCYFEYEPIRWVIVDKSQGLLVSDSILDSQPFEPNYVEEYIGYAQYDYRSRIRSDIYPSNYLYSSIRFWLAGYTDHYPEYEYFNFYRTAFTSSDMSWIKTTQLTIKSNGVTDSAYDSIFLLDRETVDAYTSSTGQPFYSAYPTAYAKSQGYTYDDIDFSWWLRDGYGSTTMYYVNDGYTCNGYQVGHGSKLQTNYSFVGVRPAIRVNLSSSLIKRSFQIDVERSTSGAPTISWPTQGASATYRVYRCDELKRDQTLDSDWTLMATLAQNTLSYTDTTARPGYGYYYRVVVTQWNIVNKSNMILYRYKLEKPRMVYAGSDETTGYPKLCWMPVNAVLHYDIERYNEDKDKWENVWRIEPEGYDMVEYIDKKATLGKQYTYRVQACPPTFERFRSDYTDEATIKCVPEKPTGLSVKITSAGMIQLAWNAVKADGYRVLYRDITDGYSTSNQWYSSYVYAGGCILSKAQPGRNYEILVAAAMSQNDNTYDSARVSVTQRCPSLPEFTVQPKNIIAFEDTNPIHVDVKVSASGTGITYKWYTFRPVVDSGSFTMEYTCTDGKYGFDLTREESEMQFYVQAVDQYGRSTYSDTAKVAYISQPKGVTANVGNEAQFTVTTDFPEFIASYQWQSRKDSSSAWSNSGMPGAKTATLKVATNTGLHGWQFRCVVTDSYGKTIASKPAVLKIVPKFTKQPKNATTPVGDIAEFTIAANGKAPLSYQWQSRKNASSAWSNSGQPGAKTATLKVTSLAGLNGWQFRCVVTDGNNMSWGSNAATLTVVPKITTQPKSTYAAPGTTIKFTVAVNGKATLKYQWQSRKNASTAWSNSGMPGAKTATLSVTALAGLNGWQFRCVVTDGNGNSWGSNAATLFTKLGILTQPKNVTATAGSTAKFTVVAYGKGTLKYQWQSRKNETAAWSNSGMPGAKTATLSVTTSTGLSEWQFRCIITDGDGNPLPSNAAMLIVK